MKRSIEFCKRTIRRMKEMREALIWKLGVEMQGGLSPAVVRRAVTEAEALASTTSYPILFMPVLAEEKVANAWRWSRDQHGVLERQRVLAAKY